MPFNNGILLYLWKEITFTWLSHRNIFWGETKQFENYSRHCSKSFKYIILFKPHNPMRQELFSSLYKWSHLRFPESLSNLCMVVGLVNHVHQASGWVHLTPKLHNFPVVILKQRSRGWKDGSVVKRIQVQFPPPTSGSSQPPLTLAPERSLASEGKMPSFWTCLSPPITKILNKDTWIGSQYLSFYWRHSWVVPGALESSRTALEGRSKRAELK